MKILMISPPTGGIDVYVKVLAKSLRKIGAIVDIDGSKLEERIYNVKKGEWLKSNDVKKLAEKIASRINFKNYDLVAFHYGKNDIEQYLPVIFKKAKTKSCKFVYFVHFLSRNLFDQFLDDEKTKKEVEKCVVDFYDGYVFFGNYAKEFMEKKYNKHFKGVVSYLPETHSHEVLKNSKSLLNQFLPKNYNNKIPTLFFPGFPANYKNHDLLLSSFELVKNSFYFVFAGQGWQKKLGFTHKRMGNVRVFVVDKYLSSAEYKLLTKNSFIGVFPYQQPKNKGEYFQGSGTLPNFIFSEKASVVLNEGAMAEYVGRSGIVVKDSSVAAFAKAIDSLFDTDLRQKLENHAQLRKRLFLPDHHAKKCLQYFEKLCSNSI